MNTRYIHLLAVAAIITACDNDDESDNSPPMNTAPVVGAIDDKTSTANGASAPFDFTVEDEFPSSLSLSAMSDNPGLLPDDAYAFGGTDNARTLTITPTIDQLGDALVTVIATDSRGLSASSAFMLTVNPEQKSLAQFARAAFMEEGAGEPEPVNAVEFQEDAENDDFVDLLAE